MEFRLDLSAFYNVLDNFSQQERLTKNIEQNLRVLQREAEDSDRYTINSCISMLKNANYGMQLAHKSLEDFHENLKRNESYVESKLLEASLAAKKVFD